jgi:hypothetical protein
VRFIVGAALSFFGPRQTVELHMHIPEPLARRLDQGRAERALLVERSAINETARTATLSFASEAPYERFWGVEILDCAPASIRQGRLASGANLLCDHDPKDVIGVVESIQFGADRVARAVVRFGKGARAEEVWQDVRDGIRRNVSVGYLIHKAQLVETEDGLETYRVTDWEPYEVSLVSIPADASVGVGRSDAHATQAPRPTLSLKKPNLSKEPIMENQTTTDGRNHAQEIAAASAFIPGGAELAMRSLQAGHTVEQFQAEAIKAMSNKPLPTADISSGWGAANRGHGAKEGIGQQVVRAFNENREIFNKTKSVSLQLRAATDTITTSSGRTIVSGGVGFVQGGVLGLQNALPIRGASSSALEYSRYTGQQGAAGVQAAEGDTKAAVRPDHSLITQTALTVAGYAKMSRQSINDQSELIRAVEVTLNRSVATALDAALVNGATGFSGGFEGLATAYTSLVYASLVDAISEGVSTMQTAGFSPDVVALNPADWLAITTAKGTANDHYLSGSYLAQIEPVLRGLRVVLSPSVDAGKGLVLDSSHSELLLVDDFTVEIGYSGDDFIKNLSVLLGEMRVIPVFRTVGSARLITPAA